MNIISGIGESGFLAHSAFSAGIATKDSNGNDITATYLTGVDLTPYQTIEGMTAYQEAGDYLTTADSGSFLTAVPDTYLQNTDLEISDNKITGISGIPLAAGGGVTGDYELSAGSGISIVDYPLEQKTVISVTAQGGNPEVEQAVIDNSATWNTVSDKLDTTAFSDVSGTFLTAHQDLSDYQTIAGMTAYQEAGNYLSANALDNLSGDWNEVSAKLDTTAFSDVSGTFLTAHQDISNKLDTTAFSDVSGSFLTAVPDTYLQNTDLSTEDGKVTAISGIPLSAGGDVPEGVMVESGLEYNAVNEISGYNGSAIAQYGAEKQWLVHDDTIVSISNSAQYALGVNLSAVAQLLGVDETVLFSGSDTNFLSSFNTNESITNFNTIKAYTIIYTDDEYISEVLEYDTNTLIKTNEMNVGFSYIIDNGWKCWGAQKWHITNNSAFELYRAGRNFIGPNTTAGQGYNDSKDAQNGWIYKIVGIGRKA